MSDELLRRLAEEMVALRGRVERLEGGERPVRASGTFTPFFGGEATDGAFTYAQQIGRYVRDGGLCHVTIVLQASARSAAATASRARIKGLPFAAASDTPLAVGYTAAVATSTLYGLVRGGSTFVELHDATGFQLTANVWQATSHIVLAGAYRIA